MTKATRLADETHYWIQRGHFEACKLCGIVRRRDRRNTACKGPVKIKVRATTGDSHRE